MANLLFFTAWIIRLWRPSLRRAAFVFVLKLKEYTDVEQLLTCSYARFWLLKRILVLLPYSTIFVLSQGSSYKPHHIPESTVKYLPLLAAKNNMGNYRILVRKSEHLSYSISNSVRVNVDRKGTNSI